MGINQYRKVLLLEGFAKVTQIQKFVNCDFYKAKKIMNEIKKDIEADGKKCFSNKIPTKRLLPYVDLTEKKIFEYAEIEKNESAGTDSNQKSIVKTV